MLFKWTILAALFDQATSNVSLVPHAQIIDPVVTVDAVFFSGDEQPIVMADSENSPPLLTSREKGVIVGILVVLTILFAVIVCGVT